ncbi:MAG: glycosyltransferase family 4 protein [Coxiellaceae bacterium]|jgi:glycosyltransferase involved in cell wall biosynthesis|nr:glycosyltransferase family 4 protein [Coxiellaceae bacterium]
MRVLYLHQYFSTSKGATGGRSYEFAKALIAKGHSVTMLCGSACNSVTGLSQPFYRGRRHGIVEGIEVVEIDLNYSNYDSFFKRALKFLKFVFKTMQIVIFTGKYDLLYASSTPLTVAIPGILAKIIRRKLFVLEIRDLWPELPKAMGVIKNPFLLSAIGILERVAYYFADVGVGLSPGICEGMSRFGSLPTGRIVFIPNGCDIDFFQKTCQKSEYLIPRTLVDLLATKFTAIFSGAHGVANGLGAVLDVASVLQKKGVLNIALVFIGDGKMKPFLIERTKREQLQNCYFFDYLSKELLGWILKQAGVGLMLLQNIPAFYYGTSPNKFFDYIASGLPVINNYPGWIADLIQENQCGVVVPPDSPEDFANVLVEFANLDTKQRESFSYNVLKLAKNKFDRKKLAEKFVGVCEKVYAKKII